MPDDKNKEDKPKILIDSDWKDEAEREKDELAGKAKPDAKSEEDRGPLPPPDFLQHCASLAGPPVWRSEMRNRRARARRSSC
jgi:hypothetical protein